jgi:hypothetical protein
MQKHKYINSKDFLKACRICDYSELNPIHFQPSLNKECKSQGCPCHDAFESCCELCKFEPEKKSGSANVTESVAEYKQKLIKRIKELQKVRNMPINKAWTEAFGHEDRDLGFEQAMELVLKVLDEVEAVIREEGI